ncbi:MAG TPA: sigma factor-like helix-turn-helix DNA-binding protein [Acidimicrobiales bacterium]|nr:sigma factor-like helix-turn-helix DNA-binding protein [Acidimicrobiales bacterium]
MAEVGAGDEEALAELYERHAGHVFSIARRIVSDVELAEDVVASVFVALWRSPGGYDPRRGSVRTHLMMEARRRSLELVDPAGENPSERGDRATDAAGVLSPRERQIIELAYFGGRTSKEIGAMFGLPASEVCRIIQSGLEQLRWEGRVAEPLGRSRP